MKCNEDGQRTSALSAPMTDATALDTPNRTPQASAGVVGAPADVTTDSTGNGMLMRAIQLQGEGRDDEAATLLNAYLATSPDDPIAVYSLCVILMKSGQKAEALSMAKRALQKNPGFAPLWMAHGSLLQGLGEREAALASYEQALTLKPDYIEALINSGAILRETHQHAKALERFNQALKIKPDHPTALGNCAILLTEFKQYGQAISMFQRLKEVQPDYDYIQGMLCYERLHICDWTDFAQTREDIIEDVRQGKPSCKSLAFMAISDDAQDHQTCARTFARRFPASSTPLWQGERYRHDRIRVAYVSADLREHPVGHLMAGIFEHHDHRRFDTIAISLGVDDQSRLRRRMLRAFDRFIDARSMNAREIAQTMRDMEVDIAIDLGGYTSDSRTDIFSWRPAPAHVNYLGYPGTMGLPYMDYIIADPTVIPPSQRSFYDEQVLYLPDSYLPVDTSLVIPDQTPTRAECGLPDDVMVYCSFNHDYKITPPMFSVWMNILRSVPGSVLWLMSRNSLSQDNLRAHAQAQGIDPQRLVFATRVPRVEDHLARYRQADLFLDTNPYNAHTTAADALMAGLPVLTCMGQSFPSRVAGSLLQSLKMPELITESLQDYEARAILLGKDSALRQQTRERLARHKTDSSVFDTASLCRQLEALYTGIWRRAQLPAHGDALSPSLDC